MCNLCHSKTAPLFDHLRGTARTGVSWAGRGKVRGHMYPSTAAELHTCDASAQVHPQAGKTGRHAFNAHPHLHPHPHARKNRGPAQTGMLQPPRFSFSDCRPLLRPSSRSNPPGLTACTSPTTWQQCISTQPIPPSHLVCTCTQYVPFISSSSSLSPGVWPFLTLEYYFARIPPSRSGTLDVPHPQPR